MDCMVCGHDISGRGRCPVCHFTVYYGIGKETEKIKKRMEFLAQNYRTKLLQNLEIWLYRCSYALEEGILKLNKEEWILMIHGNEISEGKEKWLQIRTARQRTDKSICIKIKIKGCGREKIEEVQIKAPKILKYWQIGVKMEENCCIRMLLGCDKKYESSEKINLL
ncbi:MAG: hypothetical protein Q4B90_10575 [Eubacteriales bacterium]|nr:hypothetical protein [Eubacteriales bacterium]